MASGVAVDKQCKAEFESIKMKRSYRYVIYRLSDDLRDIVVDKTAPRDASHADLVEDLQLASKSHQCRYAVYEAEYTKNDTAKSKLVFVYWSCSLIGGPKVTDESLRCKREVAHSMIKWASGVGVNTDCVTTFNEIKLGHSYRYIIFAVSKDLKEIGVLKTAPPSACYEDFKSDMMEASANGECRYAVYDAEYCLKDGQKRTKLVFFLWSPEEAKIKQKMVYTSSKDALKKKLLGISKEVQANDASEMEWSNVMEHLLRNELGQ